MVSQISLGNVYQSGGKTVTSGSASQIDTEALIKALTEAKRAPAVKLETANKTIDSKTTSYNDLKNLLTKFQTALDALRNPPGVNNASQNIFEYRTASLTSDGSGAASNYLGMTVEPGTAPQNFTINSITSLAAATKQETGVFTLANTTSSSAVTATGSPTAGMFAAGTVALRAVDGGADVNVTLSEGDSLQAVANKFNDVKARTGMQANIVKVGTNGSNNDYEIIFTSTKTGTDYSFDLETVSPAVGATVKSDPSGVLANIAFHTTQPAVNAQLKIDGVTIQRQTNSIDDLIDGITFTLKQPTAGATLSASVTPDTDIVKNALTNFADVYNEFRIFVAKQSERNANGSPKDTAVLANEPLLRTITSQVASEVTRVVAGITGGNPERLADIGINFSNFDGDATNPATKNIITIDTDKLTSALTTNFDGVRDLFEFRLESDSTSLAVYKRTNALAVSDFTLTIDRTTNPASPVYRASYTDASGNAVTTDLTATAINGGGVTLVGKKGTALEGLQLIYASSADATINVHVSQGFGDRLYSLMDSITNTTDGSLTNVLSTMAAQEKRNVSEIAKVDDAVEKYRTQLTDKYAALESALTKANNLLSLLDAQQSARNNSGN